MTTVGDYIFSKLAGIGGRRVLGYGRVSVFTSSIERNHLLYHDLSYIASTRSLEEIGAFIVSSPPNLSACYHQGSFYFPSGALLYIEEIQTAQFQSTTSQHEFSAVAFIADTSTAAAQIEQVLNSMLCYRKPGYIGVPVAVAGELMPMPSFRLPVSSMSYTPYSLQTTPQLQGSLPSYSPFPGTSTIISASNGLSHSHSQVVSSNGNPPIDEEDDAAEAAIAMSLA
ncbi:hypothetical protein CC78DRAFT_600972 [Lojkania enalia]|uniref:Uncharacterized protein n=1 Tax=Lojkania enalia TaxID=147567 RepID=A0A9P4KF79_9PLEO|nr:hypothetical protein CC78DRAFT_600972 [Didymosphaeria enalia]